MVQKIKPPPGFVPSKYDIDGALYSYLPAKGMCEHLDDEAEKLKGVKSLIRYATLCQYMLVPTEEAALVHNAAHYPNCIPAYWLPARSAEKTTHSEQQKDSHTEFFNSTPTSRSADCATLQPRWLV